MAIIGKFEKVDETSLQGTIRTLTLNIDVTVAPIAGPRDSLAPTHNITDGVVEIGVAWRKQKDDGQEYFSVKIDDPSFAQPVLATLGFSDSNGNYCLVWNRPGTARHRQSA